jgi:hypothetical protein
VLSPGERLEYRLTAPIPLPRVPRLPIRKMLSCLPKLVPAPLRRSRAGRLARAHPALAAWAAIFAAFGLAAAAQGLVEPHYRWEPERYQRWLARRGALAVKATLGEIGPSARIPSVRAESMGDWIGGTYNPSSFEVTFNSDHQWPDFFLLETAAHECVHAIILQNNLQPPSTTHGDYFLMVNETAASVLGAFITGTTYSRPGVDGSIVTEVLFQFHRSQCDPADPEGEFTAYLTPGRVASGDFDHWTWYAELVHFGAPLPLVDAIYEICYLHSDPTEAARIIAQRFMREDLDPRDQAIFEEFERTRRRWDEAH